MRVLDAAPDGKIGRKFVVGFVQHDDDVLRDLPQEMIDFIGSDHRAGGIVGIRQKDNAGFRFTAAAIAAQI